MQAFSSFTPNHSQHQCCSNTFQKYFNYKKHVTFSNGISNTYLNYFGKIVHNTKYKIHFAKVIKIQNTLDRTYAETS